MNVSVNVNGKHSNSPFFHRHFPKCLKGGTCIIPLSACVSGLFIFKKSQNKHGTLFALYFYVEINDNVVITLFYSIITGALEHIVNDSK